MNTQDLEDIQRDLKNILQQLYGKEILDIAALESALDNICWRFGVNPIEEKMNIERSVTSWTLNHLVEYNKIFMDLAK